LDRTLATDTAGVQPLGRRLGRRPRAQTCSWQPYAALVCRCMVATLVIHLITGITTHLPTPDGWKAELAWLIDPKRTLHDSSWSG